MGKLIDLIKYKQEKEEKILKEEHMEFIKLLKYFVEIQMPKHKLIRLFLGDNKIISIQDEDGIDITGEVVDEFSNELIFKMDILFKVEDI